MKRHPSLSPWISSMFPSAAFPSTGTALAQNGSHHSSARQAADRRRGKQPPLVPQGLARRPALNAARSSAIRSRLTGSHFDERHCISEEMGDAGRGVRAWCRPGRRGYEIFR